MLLNLSNHPHTQWSEPQKVEAEQEYGRIIDLAFPQVDPNASEKEINRLANHYLEQVLILSPAAVHLMGELTFVFRLCQLLLAKGIVCIASTTLRTTVDNGDGTKISRFEFVRFRRY